MTTSTASRAVAHEGGHVPLRRHLAPQTSFATSPPVPRSGEGNGGSGLARARAEGGRQAVGSKTHSSRLGHDDGGSSRERKQKRNPFVRRTVGSRPSCRDR